MKLPSVAFDDVLVSESDFLADVVEGLGRPQKRIPPKYFYDHRGSELFDRICELPEYYPTRTEIGILKRRARDIARLIGPGSVLIELGSGASRKIRLMLEALRPAAYVGVDISREFLLNATGKLARDYPWLRVRAVCADLCVPLPPLTLPTGPRVAFYPGSSIGNFDPNEALVLLKRIRGLVGEGGWLIIGVDLKKDPTILHAAYNDAAGVTAEFNLNLLGRMKRELGARLDADGFAHHAFYNETLGRIEMHLVSRQAQQIGVNDHRFMLCEGETIHTENSYKYSLDDFGELAAQADFTTECRWTDGERLLAVYCLRAESKVRHS